MKKTILAAIIAASGILNASDAFEFVNSADGYSYIQINESIESFTFKSDWHSLPPVWPHASPDLYFFLFLLRKAL